MTIIAVKDGVMAADSYVVTSGRKYEGAVAKITRGPGGLIGIAGASADLYIVAQWFAGGEGVRPEELRGGDEGMSALILRPDGSVWCMDERLIAIPTRRRTNGAAAACDFCEGAMAAGLSAEAAVALTIEHCIYVGGSVQVEHL